MNDTIKSDTPAPGEQAMVSPCKDADLQAVVKEQAETIKTLEAKIKTLQKPPKPSINTGGRTTEFGRKQQNGV